MCDAKRRSGTIASQATVVQSQRGVTHAMQSFSAPALGAYPTDLRPWIRYPLPLRYRVMNGLKMRHASSESYLKTFNKAYGARAAHSGFAQHATTIEASAILYPNPASHPSSYLSVTYSARPSRPFRY